MLRCLAHTSVQSIRGDLLQIATKVKDEPNRPKLIRLALQDVRGEVRKCDSLNCTYVEGR